MTRVDWKYYFFLDQEFFGYVNLRLSSILKFWEHQLSISKPSWKKRFFCAIEIETVEVFLKQMSVLLNVCNFYRYFN